MDYSKYHENQHSINPSEAIKYAFARLVTFKDINKILKLAITQLANQGFYFDLNTKHIKCSECSFSYSDLHVESFYQLLSEHVKFNKNNKTSTTCSYKKEHEKYLDSVWKHIEKINFTNNEKPPKKYEKSDERVKSYADIEIEIDIKKLAENGFYLVNDTNLNSSLRKIKCFYCDYECIIFRKGLLNNNYETPFDDHLLKSQNCELMRKEIEEKHEIDGFKGGNIFLEMKNTDTITSIQYNLNGNSNFDLLKNVLNKSINAACDKPFHPGYATEQSRFESYKEWPINLAQQPHDLSKAGFYYYGIKDMVKCFYCNGGLRNWDPIDEPIVEHARWFPKCPYIRLLKGAQFIEDIRERYKEMDSGFKDDYDDTPQYYDVVNNNNNNNNNEGSNTEATRSPASVKKRSISPRTINSRMDLPSIQKIIKLGFTRNMVKQVIENRLSEEGSDFNSYVELVRACYKMKENSKNIEQQFQEAFHFYISNMTMDVTYKQVCDVFRSKFNLVPLQIK
jgi:hypothetical protein